MKSDSRGRGGSVKSGFIRKGALIKHLIKVEGGQQKSKITYLTSHMDGLKGTVPWLNPHC